MIRDTLVLPRTVAETKAEIACAERFIWICDGRYDFDGVWWFQRRRWALSRHLRKLRSDARQLKEAIA